MTIPRKVRDALRERANGCCEICGKPGNNAHHRKNRSQGGNNALSNLMLLCGSGTTGCHGMVTLHPHTAEAHGWTVRSYKNPAITRVYIHGAPSFWSLLQDDGSIDPYTEVA